ncbi:MAG TPA: DUF6660 family protein [Pricia sp.]|nr:DUF6660 family protein [Pricia sp.]
MKLITVILSIYFLALNFMPCADSGSKDGDCQVVSVIGHDADHDQDCQQCSPFCQCHCCHSHVIDLGLALFQAIQPNISQENFAHFDSLGKEIPLSFLQPPRP